MAKKRNATDRASRLKELLVELGRAHSLRDPIAEVAKDLTPPQLHSLLWLKEDGALPITALAHRVHCAAPTITGVIDRLEREGLVERKRDAVDRRVVLVHLTLAGNKMAHRLQAAVIEHLSQLFAALSPADGDQLLKIASRLVEAARVYGQAMADEKAEEKAGLKSEKVAKKNRVKKRYAEAEDR